MNHDNLVLDAIEAVSYLDIPEENMATVLTEHARYLAGKSSDADWSLEDEASIH